MFYLFNLPPSFDSRFNRGNGPTDNPHEANRRYSPLSFNLAIGQGRGAGHILNLSRIIVDKVIFLTGITECQNIAESTVTHSLRKCAMLIRIRAISS